MKKGLVIHHNGPQAKCVGQDHDRCERFWRGVCSYHAQKFGSKWQSTSLYSFGFCPHGIIFVGCGWHKNQAANGSDQVGVDDGRDSEWYTALGFYGGGKAAGFDTGQPEEPVTEDSLNAFQSLRADGMRRGHCGARVLPHNVFKSKACPGQTLTSFAARLDAGRNTPIVTTPEDEMFTLAWFRSTAGSDKNMHCYRVSSSGTAVWCGTHDEIKAAEYFGATWFGPLDPNVWQLHHVVNGPLANTERGRP